MWQWDIYFSNAKAESTIRMWIRWLLLYLLCCNAKTVTTHGCGSFCLSQLTGDKKKRFVVYSHVVTNTLLFDFVPIAVKHWQHRVWNQNTNNYFGEKKAVVVRQTPLHRHASTKSHEMHSDNEQKYAQRTLLSTGHSHKHTQCANI